MLDLLIKAENIYTMGQNQHPYRQLGISKGKIAYLGDSQNGSPPVKAILDLPGKTILPGFIDTHLHLLALIASFFNVNLQGARNYRQIKEQIYKYINSPYYNRKGIICFQLEESLLEEGLLPDRFVLDSIISNVPLYLVSKDTHTIIVNSKELKNLRLSPDCSGLERDYKGQPTGILRNQGAIIALKAMYKLLNLDGLRYGLQKTQELLNQCGLTGIHTSEGLTIPNNFDVRFVKVLGQVWPISLQIHMQSRDVKEIRRLGVTALGSCLGTAVDGSPLAETAAFFEPYGRLKTKGQLYYNSGELDRMVMAASKEGLQVSLHAIGDKAIEMVLDAYERALDRYPHQKPRLRIEHCCFPSPQQVRRIAELGITVSTQPAFLFTPGSDFQTMVRLLGQERAQRYLPLKEMLNEGILISGSSDALTANLSPLTGIRAAQLHPVPEQRLSPFEAIQMYTINAARQSYSEQFNGSLDLGKDADFIVLNHNPLTANPLELQNVSVEKTFVAGQERLVLTPSVPAIIKGVFKSLWLPS